MGLYDAEMRKQRDQDVERRLQEVSLIEDYLYTFSSEPGQRVLKDLLYFCNAIPSGEAFQGNSYIYYESGRRSVAGMLMSLLELVSEDSMGRFVDAWVAQLDRIKTVPVINSNSDTEE